MYPLLRFLTQTSSLLLSNHRPKMMLSSLFIFVTFIICAYIPKNKILHVLHEIGVAIHCIYSFAYFANIICEIHPS